MSSFETNGLDLELHRTGIIVSSSIFFTSLESISCTGGLLLRSALLCIHRSTSSLPRI